MIALWTLLPLLAAAEPAYHADIARLMAFHCNRCHGDEGPVAGGLDTRSFAGLLKGGNLGPAVAPGDPENSLLVVFLEGRRGPNRRMPLGEPPLDPTVIERVRNWIGAGAVEGADTSPRYQLRLDGVRIGEPIRVRLPAPAYVELEIVGGKTLHRRAGAGQAFEWTVRREPGWPRRASVVATIRFAEAEPKGAELCAGKRCTRMSQFRTQRSRIRLPGL